MGEQPEFKYVRGKRIARDKRFIRRVILLLIAAAVVGLSAAALLAYLSTPGIYFVYVIVCTLLLGGFAVTVALGRYACPKCGKRIGTFRRADAEDGEPIQFFCPNCRLHWDTGLRAISSDSPGSD